MLLDYIDTVILQDCINLVILLDYTGLVILLDCIGLIIFLDYTILLACTCLVILIGFKSGKNTRFEKCSNIKSLYNLVILLTVLAET